MRLSRRGSWRHSISKRPRSNNHLLVSDLKIARTIRTYLPFGTQATASVLSSAIHALALRLAQLAANSAGSGSVAAVAHTGWIIQVGALESQKRSTAIESISRATVVWPDSARPISSPSRSLPWIIASCSVLASPVSIGIRPRRSVERWNAPTSPASPFATEFFYSPRPPGRLKQRARTVAEWADNAPYPGLSGGAGARWLSPLSPHRRA